MKWRDLHCLYTQVLAPHQERYLCLEDVFAAVTFLRFETVDWTAANYKTKYADCFDLYRINTLFSDGRNAIMCDRRSVKRDTDIEGWSRCWSVMQYSFLKFMDPIGPSEMPLVRNKDRVTTCFVRRPWLSILELWKSSWDWRLVVLIDRKTNSTRFEMQTPGLGNRTFTCDNGLDQFVVCEVRITQK